MDEKDLLKSKEEASRTKRKSEERLSMTRELKFKELQDKIDAEESEKALEEAIKKNQSKDVITSIGEELEQEIDALLDSETKKTRKKNKTVSHNKDSEVKPESQKDEVKINKVELDDDIYLTTSFKPLKQRMKPKSIVKIVLKIFFALLIICAFTIFIVMPIITMFNNSRPKFIYNTSIDYVRDTLNEFVDKIYLESDNTYKLNSKILVNTNMDEYKELNDQKLLFSNGFDFNNNIYEMGLYVEDDTNTKYGFNVIQTPENNYYSTTTNDTYMINVFDKEKTHFLKISNQLNNINLVSKDDYKYYINKTASILKKLITEEDLVATKEEIIIDGTSNDVVRNSFKLNKERLEKLESDMSKIILKDKRYMEIESNLTGTTLDEVKTKYTTPTKYDIDYILTFNIYTINGNKFAGFDIEENGFRNIYYYTIKNKFELHLNVALNSTCRKEGNCTSKDMTVIDLIGTTKDEKTTIDLYYNSSDIGSIIVKEKSKERISLEYKLIYNQTLYEGVLIFGYDKQKQEYLGAVSYELIDEYIDLNFIIAYDSNASVGELDPNNVIEYNQDTLDKDRNELLDQVNQSNLSNIYTIYETIFNQMFNITTDPSTTN